MKSTRTFSRRWWLLAVLLPLWAVLLVQSCDRNSKRSQSSEEVAESDSTKSENSGVEEQPELPGEAEPGTIQPEDVGPEAPTLFFLAGLKGYLEPCGCSADVLLGGIDRIVGYVDAAKKLAPDSAMIDAGDMLFEFADLEEHEIPQEKAKSDVVVAAQKALGTQVTVPGERDFALGADFYLQKMEEAGVEPIGANIKIGDKQLAAHRLLELDGKKVGVIGAADPTLYESVEGIEVSEAAPAVQKAVAELRGQGAETLVLVMHGEFSPTREVLQADDGLDFGIVGHGPRETDQVYEVDGAHTLEAYDQGRYMGVLKLYERGADADYVNAGAGSESEIEKVERAIAHKEEQLERFPPSKRRQNPPVLQRIRESIEEYEERLRELRTGEVDVPEEGNAFIYRPVPMQPGLPISEDLRDRRAEFNENLAELQANVEREVPPVEEGEAFFVGNNNCASCHTDAHDFWEGTEHASAVETLEERDKLFDQSCIGCHVVGYEQPGGSVMGKLEYEAKLDDGRTIEKNLEEVGCESCHGPGSKHMQQPVGSDGKAQHIEAVPGEDACMQCHVPEHSPTFNFDAYVKDITGEGHELKSKQ